MCCGRIVKLLCQLAFPENDINTLPVLGDTKINRLEHHFLCFSLKLFRGSVRNNFFVDIAVVAHADQGLQNNLQGVALIMAN